MASRAVRRSRRRFHARVGFWRETAPRRVGAVSGAVIAIDRDAWLRVGKFDERYRLYYEEIDFMRGLAREGLAVLYVPSARCQHIYDQSAAGGAEHREKFAESEALYQQKWFGPLLPLLRLVGEGPGIAAPPAPPLRADDQISVPLPPLAHVVEVSPLESFETAAGHFPISSEARFPAEVRESFHGESLFVRVVEEATGREVSRGLLHDSA
ncbi:MAG: hypothetical protein HYU52_17350 [Acidobacteria bacterium]|nr:hypothetical protein [Acidobacteriota bacterium]